MVFHNGNQNHFILIAIRIFVEHSNTIRGILLRYNLSVIKTSNNARTSRIYLKTGMHLEHTWIVTCYGIQRAIKQQWKCIWSAFEIYVFWLHLDRILTVCTILQHIRFWMRYTWNMQESFRVYSKQICKIQTTFQQIFNFLKFPPKCGSNFGIIYILFVSIWFLSIWYKCDGCFCVSCYFWWILALHSILVHK